MPAVLQPGSLRPGRVAGLETRRAASGAYRLIYIAAFVEVTYVVHSFMKPKMKRDSFANVWDAIEDDPEVAANLTMRSTC
jgi:hypothetical protein